MRALRSLFRAVLSRADRRAGVILALISCVLLSQQLAKASSNSVLVESVEDYSLIYGNHGADAIYCHDDGDGFYTTAPSIGPPFVPGLAQWHNWHYAFDTDFYDPELTGSSNDSDVTRFDHANLAVSFFCGHGSCGDDVTTTLCTSQANCTGGKVCPGGPPGAQGYSSRCVSNTPASHLFQTASSQDKHGHFAKYGATTIAQGGGVAWGESTQAGTWKGAGTNGGTNMVAFVNSCGLRAPFWTQVTNAFAGVHMAAGAMPITVNNSSGGVAQTGIGDTEAEGHRGGYFAAMGVINPFAAVSTAWLDIIDSLTSFPGDACPDFDSNYAAGGGNGFLGCGCQFVLSQDSTWQMSIWHASYETWVDLQNDDYDSKGTAGGIWGVFHCNYDNVTYPFTK